VKVEGLGQVGIEADSKPAFFLVVSFSSGEGNHSFPWLTPSGFRSQVETIAVGQADIANQTFKLEIVQQLERVANRPGGIHLVTATGEKIRQNVATVFVVFD